MPNNREFVALALRNARENCGLSQQAVADQVGLSRSVLAQVELGNRPVSPEELAKLAGLYRRSTTELSASPEQTDDEVLSTVLRAAPWLDDRRVKSRLQNVLSLCGDAVSLERTLGRILRGGPPHYDLEPPRSIAEAIAEGEQVAQQERLRLGLGAGLPVGNASNLLTSQGVRVAVVDFPDEVIGVFIRHPSVGPTIIAGGKQRASRERFGLLHGYAHALFERGRTVAVTTPINSGELVEIRADAFATAFLLPAAGVDAAITILDKGRPSRQAHTLYALASDDAIHAEVRSTPGSQTLTYLDAASIARRFGTSYPATVYRLQALGVISKPQSASFLRKTHQRLAREYAALFRNTSGERRQPAADEGVLDLKTEVAHLAIEAHRRRLIDKAELASLISKLQIPKGAGARFFELAESVR
jgi:Zn-dependent peptidase ImmA (M78 family)/transcriptional regulator with XRE-family HTH domain